MKGERTIITKEQYLRLMEFTDEPKIVPNRDMTLVYGLQILRLVDIERVDDEKGIGVYRVKKTRMQVYECPELGISRSRGRMIQDVLRKYMGRDKIKEEEKIKERKSQLTARL